MLPTRRFGTTRWERRALRTTTGVRTAPASDPVDVRGGQRPPVLLAHVALRLPRRAPVPAPHGRQPPAQAAPPVGAARLRTFDWDCASPRRRRRGRRPGGPWICGGVRR